MMWLQMFFVSSVLKGLFTLTELTEDQLFEAFEYLDDLRESGATNMFGASTYVARDLGYARSEAREVSLLWMSTFDGESTVTERVAKALAQ
jgi:hypothetical protein